VVLVLVRAVRALVCLTLKIFGLSLNVIIVNTPPANLSSTTSKDFYLVLLQCLLLVLLIVLTALVNALLVKCLRNKLNTFDLNNLA